MTQRRPTMKVSCSVRSYSAWPKIDQFSESCSYGANITPVGDAVRIEPVTDAVLFMDWSK